MRFYAIIQKFSNVENIYSFDSKRKRDLFIEVGSDLRKALTYKELLKCLSLNRRIMREHKGDSGWVNGLPETFDDIEYVGGD